MIRRCTFCILFCLSMSEVFPQTGGDNVYEFLDLSYSGLITSLGGTNVSVRTGTPDPAYCNPALLCPETDNSFSVNYVNYLAGINYGMAMYSRQLSGNRSLAAGINYLNYGSFISADESGNITGKFSASEYAFPVFLSHGLDSSFTIGIDFKPVLSHLEKYTSLGFAIDLGAEWLSRNKLISAGFVIRNAGLQITTYEGEKRRRLPFEIQSGVTAKLSHAPLRFSLTVRHLEKFRLTTDYYPEKGNNRTGELNDLLENLVRHFIAGVEIIPHRNFYFSGAYNCQRRKELKTDDGGSAAGFSWGFGIRTSFLDLEFGRASYHIAGSSTNITVIIRPENITKKSRG